MSFTGFQKTCGKRTAGVVKIGLIDASDISSVIFSSSDDTISAVTLNTGVNFARFEFDEDECEFQENGSRENNVISFEQNLIFKMSSMNSQTREAVEEIAEASYCGLVALVVMAGRAMLVGWDKDMGSERPLKMASSTGTTGKALSDASGEEITISRTSTMKAQYLSDFSMVDALFGEDGGTSSQPLYVLTSSSGASVSSINLTIGQSQKVYLLDAYGYVTEATFSSSNANVGVSANTDGTWSITASAAVSGATITFVSLASTSYGSAVAVTISASVDGTVEPDSDDEIDTSSDNYEDYAPADFIEVSEWQDGETRIENVRVKYLKGDWATNYFPWLTTPSEGLHLMRFRYDIKGVAITAAQSSFMKLLNVNSDTDADFTVRTRASNYSWAAVSQSTEDISQLGEISSIENWNSSSPIIIPSGKAGTGEVYVAVTVTTASSKTTSQYIAAAIDNDLFDWVENINNITIED